jgi:hypothetical protein
MQMVDGEFQSWTNGVLIYDNVFDRGAENNLDFKATDYVSIYNNTFKRQNWDHHGATEMVQSLIQFFRPYDFDECGGYCHHDYPHHYRIYENIFEINHGETGSQEYGSAISFNNASNVDIRNNEIIDCFPAIRATLTSDTDGDYIVTQNNHIRSDKSPDKARDDTCDSANGGDRKCSAILYNSAYFGSNSAILNNSIYFTGAKAFYGIYLHSSVDDILNIKNNIVQLDTAANSYPLYIQGAGIDQTGIDYNTHYNDNSGTKAVWDRTAEVDTKGTNDKNRLPKFTSISDLRLQADSSETNTGTDAGTTTDDCVADITAACVNDPTSSWPDAVVYMDQDDYGSSWTRGAFGNPCTPSPPSITDPTPSETEVPLNREVDTAAFADQTGCSTSHVSSDWEIDDNSDFSSPIIWTYNDTSNKITWTPTLPENGLLYIRARHTNANGDSAWSSSVYFETVGGIPPEGDLVALVDGNSNTFQYCVFEGEGSEVTAIKVTGTSNKVYNSLILNAGVFGVDANQSMEVKNTGFRNNAGGDIDILTAMTVTADSNSIQDAAKSGDGTYSSSTSDFSKPDPLLLPTYKVSTGSHFIDAAADLYAAGQIDIFGTVVTNPAGDPALGTALDIGVYEAFPQPTDVKPLPIPIPIPRPIPTP